MCIVIEPSQSQNKKPKYFMEQISGREGLDWSSGWCMDDYSTNMVYKEMISIEFIRYPRSFNFYGIKWFKNEANSHETLNGNIVLVVLKMQQSWAVSISNTTCIVFYFNPRKRNIKRPIWDYLVPELSHWSF